MYVAIPVAYALSPVLQHTTGLGLLVPAGRFELKHMKTAGLFLVVLAAVYGQVPNPTQQGMQGPADTGQPMPIFRVTVVSRSVTAINYHHRSGSTNITFRGTELLPQARGEARVASQMGSTKVEVHVDHLTA